MKFVSFIYKVFCIAILGAYRGAGGAESLSLPRAYGPLCAVRCGHEDPAGTSREGRGQEASEGCYYLQDSLVCRLRGGQSERDSSFDKQLFISGTEDLSTLEDIYDVKGSEIFLRKAKTIKEKYEGGWRRVKGDGNCFVRGYVFGVLENLIKKGDTEEANGLIGRLTGYYMTMINEKGLGYSEGAIEDFYRDMINIVAAIGKGTMTIGMLWTDMNDPQISNSIVFFCRLLCSCHIQDHAEQFAPFIGLFDLSPGDLKTEVKKYCLREVEPLEKEVEQLEVIALANAMGVGLRIEHLDASEGDLNHHDFPEGIECEVFMLYRPGHYDLIYPQTDVVLSLT